MGTFGNGHITPAHLPEMLRTLKPGSPFVIYLNDFAYSDEDYSSTFLALQVQGLWKIVATQASNYMSELVRPGWAITAYNAG